MLMIQVEILFYILPFILSRKYSLQADFKALWTVQRFWDNFFIWGSNSTERSIHWLWEVGVWNKYHVGNQN